MPKALQTRRPDTSHLAGACPFCGSAEFVERLGRANLRCAKCGSNPRARVTKMFLDKHVKPGPGTRILHCAPERSVARFLAETCGAGYEPADIDPKRYRKTLGIRVRRLDLCRDAEDLPEDAYDVVMHNHVLEHLPCNYTLVLQRLQRAVKPGGVQLFSTPIFDGYYAENLDPGLGGTERRKRFSQSDHLRRFGRADFAATLGAVFGLDADYSLTQHFSNAELLGANVPQDLWTCTGTSLFMIRKAA